MIHLKLRVCACMCQHVQICVHASLVCVLSFLFTHTDLSLCMSLHLYSFLCTWDCVSMRVSVCDSGLGRVSIAGGLWLLRSDYIGVTGGVSRLVVLSVFCVADWTDIQRMEATQPETLGLPPRDLAELQPYNGFTQENTSDSYLICRFCVCLWIW